MNCQNLPLLPASQRPRRFLSLGSVLVSLLFAVFAATASAQPRTTGTIEGRVLNATNGQYLPNARIVVQGTSLEAFTNDAGEYRINNVPAGTVTLETIYTGQPNLTTTVLVTAGSTATQPITFGATKARQDNGTMVLDEFVVAANRYQTAEQLAINEERNSVNLKNVVASDAFGHIADGNVGEFVKYLPGVETEYGGADAFSGAGIGGVNEAKASQVSIRGFGAADTQITIDGMPLSGISPAGLSRAVGLDMISISNTSRVEIIKVATPDMSNEYGGGTVNLISRSAFEYSKPRTTIGLNVTWNTEETTFFKKTPGPGRDETYKAKPGFNISTVIPVNKKFGITVSGAVANSFSPNRQVQTTWRNSATNYSRIPAVNPTPTVTAVNAAGQTSDLAHPFVRQATIVDNPWDDSKETGSIKLDWRPFSDLTVSGGYTISQYKGINVYRRLQFSAEQPMDWGPDFVIGRPFEPVGTNGATTTLDPGNKGAMQVTERDRYGFTQQGYVKLAYNHGPWSIDGSASLSRAYGEYQDFKNKHFSEIALTLANVGQVVMTGIKDGSPGTVTIFDRNKAPLDYTNLTAWTIDNAATLDVKTSKSFQKDQDDTFGLNIRRDLDFIKGPFHLALKVGGQERIKEQKKYGLGTGFKERYVGPTLTPGGILDEGYIRPPGFSFDRPQQWADLYKIFDISQAHPEYFNPDFDIGYTVSNYRTTVQQQKSIREKRDSWYAQLEGRFFDNRLQIVGGVRKTKSDVKGFLPQTDSKWNFIKMPDGTLYTDSVYTAGIKFDGSANGTFARDVAFTDSALIARLQAAKAVYPDHLILGPGGVNGTTGNSLEATKLQFATHSVHTSTDNPYTPSVSTSFAITKNLSFKPSWSRETTMPGLDAGNGTGSTQALIGGFTINENNNVLTQGDKGGEGTISVANPTLRPKVTDSYNFTLAYYTKSGGSLTATYYIKNTRNQWENDSVVNDDPEYASIINALGLDPTNYPNWTITTTVNGLEKAKQTGYEFSVRQNLGIVKNLPFLGERLGEFGRHFNFFMNFSHKNQKPSLKANVVQLTSFASNNWNAGLNFSANRLSVSAKMTYVNALYARTSNTITYNGVAYLLYNVSPEEYKFDVDLDYQLTKRYSVWISGKNILNTERPRKNYDVVNGFTPDYARINSNYKFGVQVTAGVTAVF